MTTLRNILTMGGGNLPPVELFDPRSHALLVPEETYEAAMQAQEQNMPPHWRHRMQPVKIDGETFWGIGADVLTEALPPNGIYRHVFGHLPSEIAATVLVISWSEFLSLISQGSSNG